MRTIDTKELIEFPSEDLVDNFEFSCATDNGDFTFHFKWLNDKWNLWVTLPDGETRQAGVEPGVTSWSEFSDYGLIFETELGTIDYNSLFLTEFYLIKWL